ncbi:MAG: PfkB family carbohydrate kinase, partial [Alphaproteobacteria bacterium]|nr:PfkB family carbohydrate kinase [Alphaproteobacteria bacterium]
MADETASILCFGAMHMDKLARCHREFMPGVSNPVSSSFAVGGVGFNIARNIRLRGVDVGMVSITGDDPDGRYVKEIAK